MENCVVRITTLNIDLMPCKKRKHSERGIHQAKIDDKLDKVLELTIDAVRDTLFKMSEQQVREQAITYGVDPTKGSTSGIIEAIIDAIGRSC